jgi:hypothetical protein
MPWSVLPYQGRWKKRKEPTPLGVSKGREGHYSESRELDWPFCGAKQTNHPVQKRQSGRIEVFFEKGKVSSRLSLEEGDAPKPNCRTTKVLDGVVSD